MLDVSGIDPALASGAFVTTVTDMVGFFAFLGLARCCCERSGSAIKAAARKAGFARRKAAHARPGRRGGHLSRCWRAIAACRCRATCRSAPRSTRCRHGRGGGLWPCRRAGDHGRGASAAVLAVGAGWRCVRGRSGRNVPEVDDFLNPRS